MQSFAGAIVHLVAQALLKQGRSQVLKGLASKSGKLFEARLIHKPGDGVWFVEMEENHFVEPQTTR